VRAGTNGTQLDIMYLSGDDGSTWICYIKGRTLSGLVLRHMNAYGTKYIEEPFDDLNSDVLKRLLWPKVYY
jgi:hypothetical protein